MIWGKVCANLTRWHEVCLCQLDLTTICFSRVTNRASLRGSQQQRHDQSTATNISALLRAFDIAWLQYLEQFVAWKSADAATLEVPKYPMAIIAMPLISADHS